MSFGLHELYSSYVEVKKTLRAVERERFEHD